MMIDYLTINLFVNLEFWDAMGEIFRTVREFLDFDLNFPFGTMDLLDIFCTLSIMTMLADIAESYFGWSGSDGDNR